MLPKMKEKKIESISIAKAIAIMLMVLDHTFFSELGDNIISMFHMPLFFFFAGYCFKESNLNDFKSFAKKRFNGLYVPYVKWSIIFLLLHNLFFNWNLYNSIYGYKGEPSFKYEWLDFATHALNIMVRMVGHEQLLGGFWFLRSLLIASLGGFLVIKFCQNKLQRCFWVVCFTFILAVIASYFNKHIPFIGIESKELIATLIFYAGYLYKRNEFSVSLFFCISAAAIIVIGSFCWEMSFLGVMYWKIPLWTISSIMATIAIFKLCKILEKKTFVSKSILIYIGNNTLPILALHFTCFKIVSLIIIYLYALPIDRLAEFPVIMEYSTKGWWIAYLIIGVFSPLGFNYIISMLKKSELKYFIAHK